jgi:hypothetical protein
MASLDGYVAAPSVTIAAPTPINGVTGEQAKAAAILGVDTLLPTALGSGYSANPSAVITGGAFRRFEINPDLSGVAFSAGGVAWIISSAGYVGSALFGSRG